MRYFFWLLVTFPTLGLCTSELSDIFDSNDRSRLITLSKTGGTGTAISELFFGFHSNNSCSSSIGSANITDGSWWTLSNGQAFGPTQTAVYNVAVASSTPASVQSILFTFLTFTNYNPIFSTAYAGNGSTSVCIKNVTCSALAQTCASADSIPTQDFTIDE